MASEMSSRQRPPQVLLDTPSPETAPSVTRKRAERKPGTAANGNAPKYHHLFLWKQEQEIQETETNRTHPRPHSIGNQSATNNRLPGATDDLPNTILRRYRERTTGHLPLPSLRVEGPHSLHFAQGASRPRTDGRHSWFHPWHHSAYPAIGNVGSSHNFQNSPNNGRGS